MITTPPAVTSTGVLEALSMFPVSKTIDVMNSKEDNKSNNNSESGSQMDFTFSTIAGMVSEMVSN